MIETAAVKGIVILAGIGGFLTCLALALVGGLIASPPRYIRWRRARQPRVRHPVRGGLANRTLVRPARNAPARPVSSGRQRNPAGTELVGPAARAARGAAEVAPRGAAGRAPIVVHAIDRKYWEMQHWDLVGNRLTGFYRTPRGSFQGYVLHPQAPRPEFYIVHPPPALQNHPHWVCFHPAGANTFSIHFHPAPPNPDAGILAVETVLMEALTGQRR